MKTKLALITSFLFSTIVLSGCERAVVFRPNGPVSEMLAKTINTSAIILFAILAIVCALFAFMLIKYRASKLPKDYEPPEMEGSTVLEIVWTAIPIIIVIILSVITVKTTYSHEGVPEGYEDQKPLVIYASSSDWKWHFSYPEQGIETVNYVNLPVKRPVEFRIYSFGPISSLWIPQLGGQKYGMSDMVTKVTYVADIPMSMEGKNSSFTGRGFEKMTFEALSMSSQDFDQWVKDVKANEPKLTEKKFDKLLDTDFVGRQSYSSTHLDFSPPPEGRNAGHNHGDGDDEDMNMPGDAGNEDHSQHEK
ncbi:cytochrome aa3 quinol oxidase subunit II [Bacillus massiliigorillae]|uniref:cytochrome aa3 quinol oxidase subunit II n=1 Tax=Bacillus massiliigorillae TaxID=1243664 RepID=UPI0003A2EBC7|nr:cytochrome aa3 quinol oxidase subunit II [Bacillus massiliigorillae]